jgi:WhiB family redox-sensing transcriptional regulator
MQGSTGTDHAWMRTASCRGRPPGEFFPSDGVGVERAKKLCVQCPVRLECLEYALSYRIDHGVWGGCSERERRRILRRRRLSLAGITG